MLGILVAVLVDLTFGIRDHSLCEPRRLRRPLPTESSEGASCLGQPNSVAENATRAAHLADSRVFLWKAGCETAGDGMKLIRFWT